MSQLFASGDQSIGASASASVLPGFWVDFLEDWLVWFTYNQRDSQESSIVRQFKSINFGALNLLYGPTLTFIQDNWKNRSFAYMDFVSKVTTLLYNMLSRLVIAFLPRGKHLLISWLQSLSTVILEPKEIKSVTVSNFFPSVCHEMMGPDAMILVFWMLSFKPAF